MTGGPDFLLYLDMGWAGGRIRKNAMLSNYVNEARHESLTLKFHVLQLRNVKTQMPATPYMNA